MDKIFLVAVYVIDDITLTPEERSALKNVIRKEGVNNVISTVGGRLGSLIAGGVGATLGGIPGMLAAGGASLGARTLSEAFTQKAIANAMKTVLIGKDAQMAARTTPRAKRLPFNDKEWIKALIAGRAASASTATPSR